jgi:predicted transcriptional regulator of viral defense system
MDKLITFFQQHSGYGRMKDLKASGIHTRTIAKAVSDGTIEKIKPGLYKFVEFPWDEHSGFVDICMYNKKSVICLASALEYYDLTTYLSAEIQVAVPHNTDRFDLEYPPVKVYYFTDRYYSKDIKEMKTSQGMFRIYQKEKTICDMFRFRNKIGEDIALESLKNYVKQRDSNLNKLQQTAREMQIEKVINPYLKALIHR